MAGAGDGPDAAVFGPPFAGVDVDAVDADPRASCWGCGVRAYRGDSRSTQAVQIFAGNVLERYRVPRSLGGVRDLRQRVDDRFQHPRTEPITIQQRGNRARVAVLPGVEHICRR